MITPVMYIVLCFVPSGILSLLFEVWHRSHASGNRAPLKDKLLRPPGESSRRRIEQLDGPISELLIWVIGFPCTLWVYYLSSTGTGGAWPKMSAMWIAAMGAALVVFALFTWKLAVLIKERNQLRLNFSGERAVGEQLNRLMCDGCQVIHDFPLNDYENIDHIVVAPSGVFAVETRVKRKGNTAAWRQTQEVLYDGHKLEFPFHTESCDLVRAREQAQVLSKFLTETFRETILVQPLLTLPGWQVIARGNGEVQVLNPRMIDGAVLAPGTTTLSPERIKEIAAMLELKCRDVEF